jgi:hypothetical protein
VASRAARAAGPAGFFHVDAPTSGHARLRAPPPPRVTAPRRWALQRLAAEPSSAAAGAVPARYGYARVHASLAGLLTDPAVDAVVFATPSEHHEPRAVACLEA